MSENIIVAMITGTFSLLTAVVTIVLQGRIRRRSTEAQHQTLTGADTIAGPRLPSSTRHIGSSIFVAMLILIGVSLIKFTLDTMNVLDSGVGDLLIIGGTAGLILLFAWSDAGNALFARQVAIQIRILALYAGLKIALILEYREDCITGVQYREWFCPNMGLPLYADFLITGWMLWVFMVAIGGLAVELMHRMRRE